MKLLVLTTLLSFSLAAAGCATAPSGGAGEAGSAAGNKPEASNQAARCPRTTGSRLPSSNCSTPGRVYEGRQLRQTGAVDGRDAVNHLH